MAVQKLSAQLKQQIARNNLIETLGKDASDFGKDFKKQVKTNVQGARTDTLSQLIGPNEVITRNSHRGGELKMGEEITLKAQEKTQDNPQPERKPAIAAAIEYHSEISRSSERMSRKESREIEYQIKEIMEELQRLVSSSDKIVQMQYADFSVGQSPVKAGAYHLNYFSWMLSVIRQARQKVEDSGAWMQVAKKKGGMLNAAWKKGNTSVTMSNERQVATQTG